MSSKQVCLRNPPLFFSLRDKFLCGWRDKTQTIDDKGAKKTAN
jgi:hypothetical protein